MDSVFILILSLGIYLYIESGKGEKSTELRDSSHMAELMETDTPRVAKLNESFYEDTKAFTEISSVLGFPME